MFNGYWSLTMLLVTTLTVLSHFASKMPRHIFIASAQLRMFVSGFDETREIRIICSAGRDKAHRPTVRRETVCFYMCTICYFVSCVFNCCNLVQLSPSFIWCSQLGKYLCVRVQYKFPYGDNEVCCIVLYHIICDL